jgi:hypothetical protein
VLLTLHVESSAPDEVLEQLFAHLAEDRDFFNETRPKMVRSAVGQGALSGDFILAINLVLGVANVIGAGASVAQAGGVVRRVARKLHDFLAEHRGGGVKAVGVTVESGDQKSILANSTLAQIEDVLEQAVRQAVEKATRQAAQKDVQQEAASQQGTSQASAEEQSETETP